MTPVEEEAKRIEQSLNDIENQAKALKLRLAAINLTRTAKLMPWVEYYGEVALFWDSFHADGMPVVGTIKILRKTVIDSSDNQLRFYTNDLFDSTGSVGHGYKYCKILSSLVPPDFIFQLRKAFKE